MNETQKRSILQMARGAIQERADYEMSRLLANILDANTSPTAKRKLTITFGGAAGGGGIRRGRDRGAVTGDAPREAAIHRLPHGYRVLTPEESMEIECLHLREMADRYGAQIERARRERDVSLRSLRRRV